MKKETELGEKALAAMRDAARRVAEEHRRAGIPLVIWKDGKVVREFVKEAPAVRERPARYTRG